MCCATGIWETDTLVVPLDLNRVRFRPNVPSSWSPTRLGTPPVLEPHSSPTLVHLLLVRVDSPEDRRVNE